MRRNAAIFSVIAATGLFAVTAFAQEPASSSTSPSTQPTASAPATPARGSTMEDVRAKFGSPTQEVPAVGQPPITRWEYPGLVVFFEHDRVLHTVVVRG